MTKYPTPSENRILDPLYRDRYIYNRGGTAYGVYKTKRFSLAMNYDIRKKSQLLSELNTRILFLENKRQISAAISQDGSLYGAFKEFFDVYVRKLSKATQSQYKNILRKYFAEDMDLNEPEAIKYQIIELMANISLSNNTKWKHLQRINVFLNYCVRQRYLEFNPIPKELMPEYEIKPVQYFSEEQFHNLKNYFFETNYEMYLLITFIEMTACRIDEAIKLTWDKISDKEIMIIGKTDRNFPIFPFPKLPSLLNEIKKINPTGKLFSWKWEQTPQKLLKAARLALGIPQKYSFHAIRKRTLDKWKDAGLSIEIRTRLAGHSVAVHIKEYNKNPDWQYFESVIKEQININ